MPAAKRSSLGPSGPSTAQIPQLAGVVAQSFYAREALTVAHDLRGKLLRRDDVVHPLYEPGGLTLHDAPSVTAILAGPRVGIDYAQPSDRAAPWRLAIAGTRWVTVPGTLRPV